MLLDKSGDEVLEVLRDPEDWRVVRPLEGVFDLDDASFNP